MAREHARVSLSIWNDDDFRNLPPAAQHLYFVLMTDPSLSYCGVADWRPARIAARSNGWEPLDVVGAAVVLQEHLYVVVDPGTEEVLVRSFIRSDQILLNARITVSMVKAYGCVASNELRGVIVHELRRLHAEDPTMAGWKTTKGAPGQALGLLEMNAVDPAGLADQFGAFSEFAYPEFGGQVGDWFGGSFGGPLGANATQGLPSVCPSPSPAPSPTPDPDSVNTTAPRKRGTRIPDDFTVDQEMLDWAAEHVPGLDLIGATAEFVDYWRGVPGSKGTKLDWPATWRNRMRAVYRHGPNRGGFHALGPRRSTTDERVAQTLALAERFDNPPAPNGQQLAIGGGA